METLPIGYGPGHVYNVRVNSGVIEVVASDGKLVNYLFDSKIEMESLDLRSHFKSINLSSYINIRDKFPK